MLAVFLILYDIEFTLLFPLLFNSFYVNILQYYYFSIFILLIIASLYYDTQTNSLN